MLCHFSAIFFQARGEFCFIYKNVDLGNWNMSEKWCGKKPFRLRALLEVGMAALISLQSIQHTLLQSFCLIEVSRCAWC